MKISFKFKKYFHILFALLKRTPNNLLKIIVEQNKFSLQLRRHFNTFQTMYYFQWYVILELFCFVRVNSQ